MRLESGVYIHHEVSVVEQVVSLHYLEHLICLFLVKPELLCQQCSYDSIDVKLAIFVKVVVEELLDQGVCLWMTLAYLDELHIGGRVTVEFLKSLVQVLFKSGH